MAGNISRSNDLGIGKGILLKIITFGSIIFLVSPLIILMIFSFNSGKTVTQWEGFSMRWYTNIFTDYDLWMSVRNSFLIAIASTALSTILGTLAALAVGKYAFKGRELFQNILYIPVILPEIIFGISLLALFLLIKMPLGFISVICAHTTFSLSFVTLIVLAKLANVDKRIEEASLDLGANRWQTFRYVVFPNLAPAIISGALFAFTLSIDDFIVTFFTAGVSSATLPLKIYSLIKFGVSPALNAVSTILIIFTVAALSVSNGIQKGVKVSKLIKYPLLGLMGLILIYFTVSIFEKGKIKNLNIYNFSNYLSPKIIADFEKEYGVKVSMNYYNDNEELLSRLQMGVTGYDLIIPSSFIVEIMRKTGLIQPIDTSKITNLRYIDKRFRNLPYDPSGRYYIPYAYGFSAIVYNNQFITDSIRGWNDMYNEKYRSNILMVDDMLEAFFVGYKCLGYVRDTDEVKLDKVTDLLIKQKQLLLKYENNMAVEYMASGDVWIAQSWNGYIAKILRKGPQFKMVIPKEGVLLFVDNMCIPTNAPNKEIAEQFINFLLRPDNSASNIETILYAMPNPDAVKLLPDSMKNNSVIFPSDQMLKNMNISKDEGEFSKKLEKAWTKVKIK